MITSANYYRSILLAIALALNSMDASEPVSDGACAGELSGENIGKYDGEYHMLLPHFGYYLKLEGSRIWFRDHAIELNNKASLDGFWAYANQGRIHIVMPARKDVITLHPVIVAPGEYAFVQSVQLGRFIGDGSLSDAGANEYKINVKPENVNLLLQWMGRKVVWVNNQAPSGVPKSRSEK